jgi:hypothetical protein
MCMCLADQCAAAVPWVTPCSCAYGRNGLSSAFSMIAHVFSISVTCS